MLILALASWHPCGRLRCAGAAGIGTVGYGLFDLAGISGCYAAWAQLREAVVFATAIRSVALFLVLGAARSLHRRMAMASALNAARRSVLLKDTQPTASHPGVPACPSDTKHDPVVGDFNQASPTLRQVRNGQRTAGLLHCPWHISTKPIEH